MMPVFRVINVEAIQPYLEEQITPLEAAERAIKPVHEFMLSQTRENDLNLFVRISGERNIASPEETPIHILIPAFITSELKTAFQIGFLIFIPFLIIDLGSQYPDSHGYDDAVAHYYFVALQNYVVCTD